MSIFRFQLIQLRDDEYRQHEIDRFYEDAGSQLLKYLRDNPGPHTVQMKEQIRILDHRHQRYECEISVLPPNTVYLKEDKP